MKNQIKWLYGNELDKTITKDIQIKLDKYFPMDYVKCVLANDGAYPVPGAFNVNGKIEIFNNLFSLDLKKPCNILSIYEKIKDRLPADIIPFARDPFGDMLCFDYRMSKIPSIIFWRTSEGTVELVCESFSDLLDGLFRVEEELV